MRSGPRRPFGWSPHSCEPQRDPLGVLTFHEAVLVEGQGSQNVMRWEDYTQSAVDPADDCTIWYVGDYLKKDAPSYSTRIGAFAMPGCR